MRLRSRASVCNSRQSNGILLCRKSKQTFFKFKLKVVPELSTECGNQLHLVTKKQTSNQNLFHKKKGAFSCDLRRLKMNSREELMAWIDTEHQAELKRELKTHAKISHKTKGNILI